MVRVCGAVCGAVRAGSALRTAGSRPHAHPCAAADAFGTATNGPGQLQRTGARHSSCGAALVLVRVVVRACGAAAGTGVARMGRCARAGVGGQRLVVVSCASPARRCGVNDHLVPYHTKRGDRVRDAPIAPTMRADPAGVMSRVLVCTGSRPS
eukprot:1521833-Prymnesium_polylepis.2